MQYLQLYLQQKILHKLWYTEIIEEMSRFSTLIATDF
jgi:hypothetical protein